MQFWEKSYTFLLLTKCLPVEPLISFCLGLGVYLEHLSTPYLPCNCVIINISIIKSSRNRNQKNNLYISTHYKKLTFSYVYYKCFIQKLKYKNIVGISLCVAWITKSWTQKELYKKKILFLFYKKIKLYSFS